MSQIVDQRSWRTLTWKNNNEKYLMKLNKCLHHERIMSVLSDWYKVKTHVQGSTFTFVSLYIQLKKRKILTSKNMNIVTKKQLIKTYVWSVALYGSEIWTINKKEKDMLEALEMWCWRKMQRISWTDRRSNEDILRTIGEKQTLIDIIKRRRWQMIGHSLRH
ncbi:uncharacterized protein LOC112689047 [Sipha flava]|uniref:Uncharacterized protein LOC112689047 n=1 Tax=Sipha flava TaxID=143950 RepID=A0A8B8G510_9HEMI|nr:uncharacterized protein LOC112689047 [Sipha flava]